MLAISQSGRIVAYFEAIGYRREYIFGDYLDYWSRLPGFTGNGRSQVQG
jgi:hypothetical protein